jgi:hypothetical protein
MQIPTVVMTDQPGDQQRPGSDLPGMNVAPDGDEAARDCCGPFL